MTGRRGFLGRLAALVADGRRPGIALVPEAGEIPVPYELVDRS